MEFRDEEFEPFDYSDGNLQELKMKVLSLFDAIEILKNKEVKFVDTVVSTDDPETLSNYIKAFAETFLKKTSDNDTEQKLPWNDLYMNLFGKSLYSAESSIIPSDRAPIAAIVRYCLKNKKRVKCEVPEGCLA